MSQSTKMVEKIKENWEKKGMKTSGSVRVNWILKEGGRCVEPQNHELPIICNVIGCTLEELLNPDFNLGIAEARVKERKDIEMAAKYGLKRNAA